MRSQDDAEPRIKLSALSVLSATLSRLRFMAHHVRQTGDLAFQAFNLSGFAHCARQQLYRLGQLRNLLGDVLHRMRIAALRFKFAFKPADAARKSTPCVR